MCSELEMVFGLEPSFIDHYTPMTKYFFMNLECGNKYIKGLKDDITTVGEYLYLKKNIQKHMSDVIKFMNCFIEAGQACYLDSAEEYFEDEKELFSKNDQYSNFEDYWHNERQDELAQLLGERHDKDVENFKLKYKQICDIAEEEIDLFNDDKEFNTKAFKFALENAEYTTGSAIEIYEDNGDFKDTIIRLSESPDNNIKETLDLLTKFYNKKPLIHQTFMDRLWL